MCSGGRWAWQRLARRKAQPRELLPLPPFAAVARVVVARPYAASLGPENAQMACVALAPWARLAGHATTQAPAPVAEAMVTRAPSAEWQRAEWQRVARQRVARRASA